MDHQTTHQEIRAVPPPQAPVVEEVLARGRRRRRAKVGNRFGNVMDTRSLVTRQLPQELLALNYTGVLTENFFVEAQYSERQFTFENSGSRFTDLVNGTLMVDGTTARRWWSPTFCGVCTPEERNNENILVKGSWFLSSEASSKAIE